MIEVIKITKDNFPVYEAQLNDFFMALEETFSYYRNRGLSHITKVCKPFVYINEHGDLIGYGHLDMEEDALWLGIAVSKRYRGEGHGSHIMNHLIRTFKTEHKDCILNLAVSKKNDRAINLYRKYGFNVIKESNKNWFMLLEE
ncbi:GNAT family N-acetyltransferase [Schleiferiaceae bacterium]|nr:GNAT family N-acetyltransferase [Schleiferiaceae bacterium]